MGVGGRAIVYHVPAEYGHFSASLFLARQLRRHGARFVYMSEPDLREQILKEGFEHAPYLADRYPEGSIRAREQLEPDATWEWWLGRDLATFHEAQSGRLEASLAALEPALIIADRINPETSLVAHKLGIPFIRCSTMLPTHYQAGVPPTWSDWLPGELTPWELEAEWRAHNAVLHIKPWIDRDNPIPRGEFYKFVESCGVSIAQINFRDAFNYHVEGDPAMITCARAFDFPCPDMPDRVYLGPCLEDTDPEPWTYEGRRPDAPLIYCAFGSRSTYPIGKRMLARILDVARARPDLDIVISASDAQIAGHDIPPTVHQRAWLPQRRVLREVDLFVTHSGLASCREAIWEGVPMLAVPFIMDQRGLAARVVYHGLGERITADIPALPELLQTIDKLLTDPKYARAAQAMQAEFRGCDPEVGLRFVEAIIEGTLRAKPSSHHDDLMTKVFRNMMGED